jgi:hypothetical protein
VGFGAGRRPSTRQTRRHPWASCTQWHCTKVIRSWSVVLAGTTDECAEVGVNWAGVGVGVAARAVPEVRATVTAAPVRVTRQGGELLHRHVALGVVWVCRELGGVHRCAP